MRSLRNPEKLQITQRSLAHWLMLMFMSQKGNVQNLADHLQKTPHKSIIPSMKKGGGSIVVWAAVLHLDLDQDSSSSLMEQENIRTSEEKEQKLSSLC